MLYDELILNHADAIYGKLKAEKRGQDLRYLAPEAIAHIESDQIKALCEALCIYINREFENL